MTLPQSLLPFAAHLIPLPNAEDDLEDVNGGLGGSLDNKGTVAEDVAKDVDWIEMEREQAQEDLVKGLEEEGLELVVSANVEMTQGLTGG